VNGMSRRVANDMAKRRTGSTVTAAALIGFLILFAALPLCSAALTCTLQCCEGSGQPMEEHDAMPVSACGTAPGECSVTRALSADLSAIAIAPAAPLFAVPATAPRVFLDAARSALPAHAPLVEPHSNARPLYVLNDIFLI